MYLNNLSVLTGFKHMKELMPDSDVEVDQFIIRFVEVLFRDHRFFVVPTSTTPLVRENFFLNAAFA